MRINILLLSVFLLNNLTISAQIEQQAKSILDNFSANALGAPSITMKFDIITTDQTDNSVDTLSGSVILSKNKYRLDMPENIVWVDGETQWSYLPVEKEVTISNVDKKDHSFQNRPSEIFSMYKKGYKIRLIEDRSDLYVIDLYPEDIDSDLVRIRLSIGKPGLNLIRLEYKRQDGIVISLNVHEYNLKFKPSSDTFVYQSDKFKGTEVIDIR